MIVERDVPLVIDINTSPGMTETSLVPKAWGQLGRTFDQLVEGDTARSGFEGMKRILYLLFLVPLCLLSVLTGMYLFSRTEPVFLLKNIRIKGAEQLPESEILAKIYPFLKDSIFGTDMGKVKAAITSHPFVRDVRVKRVFPFSILIEVKERVPSALWVGPGGDIRILDEDGAPYRALYKGDSRDLFVINAKEKNEAKSIFREVMDWDRQGIIKRDDLSEVVYDEGEHDAVQPQRRRRDHTGQRGAGQTAEAGRRRARGREEEGSPHQVHRCPF